jgi:hypothetical protein
MVLVGVGSSSRELIFGLHMRPACLWCDCLTRETSSFCIQVKRCVLRVRLASSTRHICSLISNRDSQDCVRHVGLLHPPFRYQDPPPPSPTLCKSTRFPVVLPPPSFERTVFMPLPSMRDRTGRLS